MNKKNLQIVTFILALIPVITGLIGLTGINSPFYGGLIEKSNILLDSNLRFFSGFWLGLGLALFYIIKTIERQTLIFRIIWICIFIGGLGRILSMIFIGIPPVPFIIFTVLEIVGPPLFIYWQNKIAVKTDLG